MSADTNRIVRVTLDERSVVRRSAEVEHERAVAIFDLIEGNVFAPLECAGQGPYGVDLGLRDNRLVFAIQSEDGQPLCDVVLSVAPLRGIVRDYFTVCDSYYAAIKRASLARIEACDVGRRSLHNEGAALLRDLLAQHVTIDLDTARRLFTLICVLHVRG